MSKKKIVSCGALGLGSLITLAGIWFAVMYVIEAIVIRIGEPDQSLLFWYLPFLFIGLIGVIVGLGLAIWGASRLKKDRE